jgi:hypothetical protein
MMPRDARYAHWQQLPEDELDYEPEPGCYAPPDATPDPQTALQRFEAFLTAECRRRARQEDACRER